MLALVVSMGLSCLYVGIVNLWRRFPRDHAETITKRAIGTLSFCCVSWIPTLFVSRYKGESCATLLGLKVHGIVKSTALPLGSVLIAYSGMLLFCLVEKHNPFSQAARWKRSVMLRNLVIAPITEEWVFRASMVPLFLAEGWSPPAIVLLCPLLFGISHVHHISELIKVHRWSTIRAVKEIAFQIAYTTLFGAFATSLFLSTSNIAPCMVVHTVCNAIGIPIHQMMPHTHHPKLWISLSVLGVVIFFLLTKKLLDPMLYI
ncbi:hypothetical protein BSKO_06150 [Bryopsis sp. KO-2023]|nr:hypothetical protein BSKO_06150 [Bryopsis sp. KO-2023]